jgi:hypothetical protein
MDKNKAITGGDEQGGGLCAPNGDTFVPGGVLSSIDPAKDAGLIHNIAERHPRWRIPLALKDKMVGAIDWALDQAQADGDAKTVAGLVKTAAVLEAQNQADEHLAEKNKRLDDGLPTDNVTIRVPPPRTFKESQG